MFDLFIVWFRFTWFDLLQGGRIWSFCSFIVCGCLYLWVVVGRDLLGYLEVCCGFWGVFWVALVIGVFSLYCF